MGKAESVNEVTAVVEGSIITNRKIKSIMEIGGQGAKYITGFRDNDKSGIKISMNSNCSAGTGSFLEEQISRLNLELEDYSLYAARATSIPAIAGRCSVFAKTDITHHQQEGASVEDILLGLAYSVVRNYRVSVMKKQQMEKPILFVGGVAHNQGIVAAVKDLLGFEDEDMIIPEHFSCIGAVGAASLAREGKNIINIAKILKGLELVKDNLETNDNGISLPPLISFGKNDSFNRHETDDKNRKNPECFLGIDVGSTSTNLVLSDKNDNIIDFRYLRTRGKPVNAVRQGLMELKQAYGDTIKISGAGVTGSGRYLIGKLVGADIVKDEITAQAKAAVTIDSDVDTIFEIGGQDSKFISIKEGRVIDFQMNKVCAAGTGSFIEEQAKKFKIPIEEFGDMALNSNYPIGLGERCTVFIETSIAAYLSQGAKTSDIVSGLCYSIVKNYLNRVVGQKKIGKKIFFQGGLAFNQGVINAFRAILGKNIIIPPFFSVTGAFGAALLAKESMKNNNSNFKGFNPATPDKSDLTKNKTLAAHNRNKFAENMEELIFKGYDSAPDPGKKTVGLPRALFTFGMFSMFSTFFKELGFNVLMSEPSNDETIRLAREYSLDETCYPVKLINGHVARLIEKKVDYIFFPDLYTINHPGSESRQNYGCAYMQLAFKIINQAMELEKTGTRLLAPTIAFNQGPEFILEPAYIIKEHPNLYAILLTHHGCGPDSVVSHFFGEIMGPKPFLNIEVDEHSSGVGVMTRLEAFVNSLSGVGIRKAREMAFYQKRIVSRKVNIKQSLKQLSPGTKLYLPDIYPYSNIFREMLALNGIDARVLPATTAESLDMGRQHTMTNEYFSMTALLGDVLYQLGTERDQRNIAFFIPQTEGAEVDGQYSRFVRTKLDENGFQDVDIVSPFIEDILMEEPENLNLAYLGLLAGDLVRIASPKHRKKHLSEIIDMIQNHKLSVDGLKILAEEIYVGINADVFKKRIFAVGESLVLFNDFLNNNSFRNLENNGHRVVYAPFSESMLLLWQDFVNQNGKENTRVLRKKLDRLKDYSRVIGKSLLRESPFEENPDKLVRVADKTLEFYAGACGRYREAKILRGLQSIDGIITATSMYENTGISLNILHRGFEDKKPVLNLTFDGNKNGNDQIKLESFLFYIGENS